MTTRRQFMQSIPGAGAALAVAGHLVFEAGAAHARQAAPFDGHFHPKGKAPSKFTLDVLRQAQGQLPFADKRDFAEQQKGFIAPMRDMKIKGDAGHVAWDSSQKPRFTSGRPFSAPGLR